MHPTQPLSVAELSYYMTALHCSPSPPRRLSHPSPEGWKAFYPQLTSSVTSAPRASATCRQSSSFTASFLTAEQHAVASIAESGPRRRSSSRKAMCSPSLANARLFWNALHPECFSQGICSEACAQRQLRSSAKGRATDLDTTGRASSAVVSFRTALLTARAASGVVLWPDIDVTKACPRPASTKPVLFSSQAVAAASATSATLCRVAP